MRGHTGEKLVRGSWDRRGRGWWGCQAIPEFFQSAFGSFASSERKGVRIRYKSQVDAPTRTNALSIYSQLLLKS